MLICHSRVIPTDAVIAGSGAPAFITAWQDLFNGRASDATRIKWGSGAQTTASVTKLQFPVPSQVIGAVSLIGANALGLDRNGAGIKVVFTGKRAIDGDFTYALGGNTASQRLVWRADGSLRSIGICDAGLDPVIGIQVAIYNDQDGAVNIAADAYIDLGDVWISPAFDRDIDVGWRLTPPKNGIPTSINKQPWPNPRPGGYALSFARRAQTFDETYVDGAQPSWQTIAAFCGGGNPSILIPEWQASGGVDAAKVHATAIYGTASITELQRNQGVTYDITGVSDEIPALPA